MSKQLKPCLDYKKSLVLEILDYQADNQLDIMDYEVLMNSKMDYLKSLLEFYRGAKNAKRL